MKRPYTHAPSNPQLDLYLILDVRVVALHSRLENACVCDDEHPGGANQPEESSDRTCEEECGDSDDEETHIEVFLGHGMGTNLRRFGSCVGTGGK